MQSVFSSKGNKCQNFARHLWDLHQDKRSKKNPRVCPFCQEEYSASNLARHKATCPDNPRNKDPDYVEEVPEGKAKCPLCEKYFSKSNYRKHFILCKKKQEENKFETVFLAL